MVKLYIGKAVFFNPENVYDLFEERTRLDGRIFFEGVKVGSLEEVMKETAKRIWESVDFRKASYSDKFSSAVSTEFDAMTLYRLTASNPIIREITPIGKEEKKIFSDMLIEELQKYISKVPMAILKVASE